MYMYCSCMESILSLISWDILQPSKRGAVTYGQIHDQYVLFIWRFVKHQPDGVASFHWPGLLGQRRPSAQTHLRQQAVNPVSVYEGGGRLTELSGLLLVG